MSDGSLIGSAHGLPEWAQRIVIDRAPDFVVGGTESPYLLRWFILPRNPLFNAYLHKFMRSDDDRAHHDHPWLFNISFLLKGRYREHMIARGGIHRKLVRVAGQWVLRWLGAPHRVELFENASGFVPCWTLFITGPRIREWGFHCPDRWVHWTIFTSTTKGEKDRGESVTGRGCGD